MSRDGARSERCAGEESPKKEVEHERVSSRGSYERGGNEPNVGALGAIRDSTRQSKLSRRRRRSEPQVRRRWAMKESGRNKTAYEQEGVEKKKKRDATSGERRSARPGVKMRAGY